MAATLEIVLCRLHESLMQDSASKSLARPWYLYAYSLLYGYLSHGRKPKNKLICAWYYTREVQRTSGLVNILTTSCPTCARVKSCFRNHTPCSAYVHKARRSVALQGILSRACLLWIPSVLKLEIYRALHARENVRCRIMNEVVDERNLT
jgi:hypothetical protein